MTLITFSDGKVVMRDDKVGTEQACCCGGCPSCISLDMFIWSEYSGPRDVQARYDEVKPWFDALQGNLEAAGWTVARTDRLFFGDAEENSGFGPGTPPYGLDVKITATCECCIENITQCELELNDQPEGLWVQVIPNVEDLAGAQSLSFSPPCLVGQDCFVPARINGVGFDNPSNAGWWVPVCDVNAEHCNPLP